MLLIGSLYAAGAVHPTAGAARWVVIVTIYICKYNAMAFRPTAHEEGADTLERLCDSSDDLGRQHQGVGPRDTTAAHQSPGSQSRQWFQLGVQLLRGLHFSSAAGQEHMECVFLVWRMHCNCDSFQLLFHDRDQWQISGTD